MSKRERPVIEHLLALIDLFQTGRVVPGRRPEDLLPEEEELQAAREMMDFMEEMPGGFLIYQAGGNEEIVFANRGLLRIFRCDTLEEFRRLTGNSFRGIVHPDDLAGVEESIQRQIAGSRFDLDYVEYRITTKDGTIRWIEDYGHFVRSEIVGDVFYVFLVDATEKKEQLLQERARSEREWQNRIATYDEERALINQEHLRRLEVIEGLSVNYESIFYLDMEDERIRPYRISGRTEAIFSAREAMPYGDYLASYIGRWVHEEDRERVAGELSPENVRRKLSGDLTFYINYRVVERGVVEYLQIRFVNVGRKDRASQVVLGCRRVDEELRREMEQKQTLEEALYNANSSIMAKNTFLSNMSHDMRTPLNAIFGFTALARHHLDSPEAIAGYLDLVDHVQQPPAAGHDRQGPQAVLDRLQRGPGGGDALQPLGGAERGLRLPPAPGGGEGPGLHPGLLPGDPRPGPGRPGEAGTAGDVPGEQRRDLHQLRGQRPAGRHRG